MACRRARGWCGGRPRRRRAPYGSELAEDAGKIVRTRPSILRGGVPAGSGQLDFTFAPVGASGDADFRGALLLFFEVSEFTGSIDKQVKAHQCRRAVGGQFSNARFGGMNTQQQLVEGEDVVLEDDNLAIYDKLLIGQLGDGIHNFRKIAA